jgi:hypothetical protein
MKRTLISAAAASVLTLGLAVSASASPISVTFFPGSELNNANSSFYTAFNTLVQGYDIIEDFEDRSGFTGNLENGTPISDGLKGEIATSVGTSVGSFTTDGGVGNGTTCASLSLGNTTCDNIAIQQAPTINGQGNIIPFNGSWALNTADTLGLVWTVNTGSLFDSLVFVLRDPADQRPFNLTIEAAGAVFQSSVNLGNERLALVKVDFASQLQSAIITVRTRENDGFTFDGAAVNVVPLPAAGWMLIAGLGGLMALRRRQKA